MPVTVNVAIIGDEGSGKTSLVLSAAQRTFRPGDSVPVLPPTAFRVKLQNEECSCVCHDSSSEKMEDIKAVVRQCDVVLICFNMAAQTSLHSAIHVWLPKMTEINKEIPIIMVGCKEDQAVITQNQIALDTTINGAVNLIRYDKCSSRHPDTTMQVFQHACDACVNPVLALYNHVRERLRCKAVRAFNRILDIADEDQDGALNDDELNHFHEFCFGRSLPIDELNGLKQALMERSNDSVTTLGVTRNGFMQLQAMMIQQQRLDICWTVLRSFGYNRQLHLKPEMFAHIKDLATEPNTISMLSREAVAFLRAQFEQRCSPIDGLLPLDLLLEDTGPQSLFHNAPPVSSHAEHPLGKQNIRSLLVHSIHTRKLPLESFLCIWAYCALVDARKAVVAMLYLGYRDTYRRSRQPLGTMAADRLLVRTPRRRSSSSLTVPRPVGCGVRVFNCLLFGTKGCGKTQLLHMLAGSRSNPHAAPYTPNSGIQATRLIPAHGDAPDTILVLIEVPVQSAEELSISAAKDPAAQERLLSNDAMLFGFDSASADSYMQARALSVALSDATNNVIPVALLGLKADLGVSSSITSMAAKDRAELHVDLLPGLLQDSSEQDPDGAACRWASLVVDVCCNPAAHIASTPALAAKRSRSEYVWRCAKYAAATGAGLTGMVVLYTVVSHVLGGRSDSATSSHKDNGPRVSGALRASAHLSKA